jgi:O-glycosyl hydrolase
MKKKLWTIAALAFAVAFATLFTACDEDSSDPDEDDNKVVVDEWVQMEKDPGTEAVQVSFDVNTTYQTIEGFGFFGAASTWWDSPVVLYTDEWAEMIIGEMGLTMWRNELYPHIPVESDALDPPDENQDGNWRKQRPVVQGLVDKAKEHGFDLKIILTIWSPPASFKNNGSTKRGGTLKVESYDDYADWLISGLDMYKNDIGVDVYGLSIQNEPLFNVPYNSGILQPSQYVAVLNAIAPKIKEKHPNVKLYGAEHMLENETGNFNSSFGNAVLKNTGAGTLDVYAVHGYDNKRALSVTSTGWRNYRNNLSDGKPIWMTETSGYVDDWIMGDGRGVVEAWGAFPYAQQIGVALKEGKISAWMHWMGCDQTHSVGDPFALMSWKKDKYLVGKRYWVSKHYYRYIRPGAKMTAVTCADINLMVIPFSHPEEKRFTVVVLNASRISKKIELPTDLFGGEFSMYQTTETGTVNCAPVRLNSDAPNVIVVPGESVVTLVNSNYNP